MLNIWQLITQGDAISQSVAIILLLMSVASWVVILLKTWTLRRATGDLARSKAAFWQAPDLAGGLDKVMVFDRSALLYPMVIASQTVANMASKTTQNMHTTQIMHTTHASQQTLAQAGDKKQQLTRVLRDALHATLNKLNFGQVLLATVGSTAPFVGLLGTVWGIYHALSSISGAGQMTIAQVSGPVGEALVMTAAGLAVAIPAVLAYNVFGRVIAHIEADLEGFASDLRELVGAQVIMRSSL
jgi:biopolymer transport protein ExbB